MYQSGVGLVISRSPRIFGPFLAWPLVPHSGRTPKQPKCPSRDYGVKTAGRRHGFDLKFVCFAKMRYWTLVIENLLGRNDHAKSNREQK